MENFQTCPICMEVPAGEIFQCFAGHYICDVCISKVSGDLCPQCRVPFGSPKCRNRVLEQLLDGQEFSCKFSEQGCTHLSKREELANHFNSCSYKPVPICQYLGYSDCQFQIGSLSKSEIVTHFTQVHKRSYKCDDGFLLRVKEETLLKMMTRKRKHEQHSIHQSLISLDMLETSPLFLVQMKVDKLAGLVSFVVIKIWESEAHPNLNYQVKFNVYKENVLPSQSTSAQGSSSSAATTVVNPFPISWNTKAYNLKEAHYVLKYFPVIIPIPMLLDNAGDPGCFVDLTICPDIVTNVVPSIRKKRCKKS